MVAGLPPVEQTISADTLPFIDAMARAAEACELFAEAVDQALAKVAELDAALAGLPDDKTIRINVETSGGVGGAGLADAVAQAQELRVAWTEEAAAQAAADGAANAFGRDVERAATATEDLRIRIEDAIAAQTEFEYGIVQARIANAEYDRSLIETGDNVFALAERMQRLGPAFHLSADAASRAGGALGGAGRTAAAAAGGFTLLGTGIFISWTALHWIVAGSAELLSVGVPALVAFGAGLAVALQGSVNAVNHLGALYNVMEAVGPSFGKTAGNILGMKSALQQAQDAANPGVYEILGSMINDVKSNFMGLGQVGLQVVHMWDEFSARITTDLSGAMGTQLHGMLAGMVTDLQQLGQVLGNFGHALFNIFADMPGLAPHILLPLLDAFSRLIEVISSLPAPIITAVMAIEEFYRWGGLALRIVASLAGIPAAFARWYQGANFIRAFGQSLLQFGQWSGIAIQGIGRMVGSLGFLGPAAERAGAGIEILGAEISIGAATMDPMLVAAVAGAVFALAGLFFWLSRGKDATDKWIASSQQMVSQASDLNVLNVIGNQIAQASTRAAAAMNDWAHASGLALKTGQQLSDFHSLTNYMAQLGTTAHNVVTNSENLASALHMSLPAAMAAASQAGVNLQQAMAKGSDAFKIAEAQIKNLETGLGAMGAPAGQIGNDLMAMGIQAQLAGTKVQQLNQAWDQWIGSVTGAMGALSQVQTALGQMGKDTAATGASLAGQISSIRRNADGINYTLQGLGQNAMQSWQQFTSAIQTGNSALDTLRIGMSEGVISASQFGTTVRGLIGEMAPFTQGNRVAVQMLSNLAQEAGGPATTNLKTLEQWAGVTGRAAKDQFAKGMEQASLAMGDMAKVAQNLSAVMSSDLTGMFDKAAIQAAGLSGALNTLANDMNNPATTATKFHGDLNVVIEDMLKLHQNVPTITGMLNQMGIDISQSGVKALIAAGHLNSLAGSADNARSSMAGAAAEAAWLAQRIADLHSKNITITTDLVTYSSTFSHRSAQGGQAAGGIVPSSGLWMVGEVGPELVELPKGARVYNNNEISRALSPVASPQASAAPQVINLAATFHSTAHLDGQVIWQNQQTRTLQYNVRNGNSGAGVVAPPA